MESRLILDIQNENGIYSGILKVIVDKKLLSSLPLHIRIFVDPNYLGDWKETLLKWHPLLRKHKYYLSVMVQNQYVMFRKACPQLSDLNDMSSVIHNVDEGMAVPEEFVHNVMFIEDPHTFYNTSTVQQIQKSTSIVSCISHHTFLNGHQIRNKAGIAYFNVSAFADIISFITTKIIKCVKFQWDYMEVYNESENKWKTQDSFYHLPMSKTNLFYVRTFTPELVINSTISLEIVSSQHCLNVLVYYDSANSEELKQHILYQQALECYYAAKHTCCEPSESMIESIRWMLNKLSAATATKHSAATATKRSALISKNIKKELDRLTQNTNSTPCSPLKLKKTKWHGGDDSPSVVF
jgi:hypothetical protein